MKTIIYGYARVSTMKQRIERQIVNIRQQYPDAVIIEETFTGTRTDRPAFSKMLQQVKKDIEKGNKVVIVFDEVSRMSRDAQEGFELYQELYNLGVELVFLKEPHINTEVYKGAAERQIEATGDEITDVYISATNQVLMILARKQIELAFSKAQSEVDFLHKRTSEGVRRAMANGKTVGRSSGSVEGVDFKESKKAKAAKAIIRTHCKLFGGALSDAECMKLAGVARNSFYKYKRQIRQQLEG